MRIEDSLFTVDGTPRPDRQHAVVEDGTTLRSTEDEDVSRRGGRWAAARSGLTYCRPDNVRHKDRGK